ncbi:hypothetical protein OUZ56_011484 [Daphnia magna]|uniref:Uncharacterized protein n=1 Tax=Daphnia magna TaxID=35525 RepID=A0ABQ9Z091_9CRUS|nr:hypothetical protein OUZ56_011484 [Daphnia magna]
MTDGLEILGIIRDRYDTLREAVAGGPRRAMRGIIDVGEGLNRQLQALGGETMGIVHAVVHQATLVNETLRELGEHAGDAAAGQGAPMAGEEIQQMETKIGECSERIRKSSNYDGDGRQSLPSCSKSTPACHWRTSALVLHSLQPEFRASLAMSWALTLALQNGDLWRAYHEARVVVAAT